MICIIKKFIASGTIFVGLIIFTIQHSNAQQNEFILNPNKPVDLSNFKQVSGIWNLVKLSYPDAEVRFVYSSGKVDFCIFDLKQNNSFLVLSSKPHATSFDLKINNNESKVFKYCMVQINYPTNEDVQNRPFGYYFQIQPNETCQIICEGEYNEGYLIFRITRDNKGLWLGSVTKKN